MRTDFERILHWSQASNLLRSLAHKRVQICHVFKTRLQHPLRARATVRYMVSVLLALVLLAGVAYVTTASYINVLTNGDFEDGFTNQAGCGMVGAGWHCFTNGGAANYGFYDEMWNPVLASGAHGQLVEINTNGIGAPDADRFAGIYQTVPVVDWTDYTLHLKGMIRTTMKDGDPWRYRVQVGWTWGHHPDWTKVDNWTDVGWDTYYERTSPGSMSEYSTHLMAMDDYVTVYIRVWKKWGIANEEIDVNFDAISLTGRAPWHRLPGYAPVTRPSPAPATGGPITVIKPAPVAGTACNGPDLVYNGNFEHGFNHVALGDVSRSWGAFTNGGAASYGFYDEQWNRVIADGAHGQLIEINNKDIYPADNDRYAGIYQSLTGLYPGTTYELTVRGLLRGANEGGDDYRYEAQWGYNSGRNADWQSVSNWTGMDLGPIYERTDPGAMGTYRVRFTPSDHKMVLFLRGWKKWGVTGSEMDLNLDAISLRSCATTKPVDPPKPGGQPGNCTYIVAPGDSLGMIAARYGVLINDLAWANSIPNINLIFVGQKLIIPGCSDGAVYPVPKPLPVPERHIHVVRAGETFSGICAAYGVDPYALANLNNIGNINLIYVGQKLVIP